MAVLTARAVTMLALKAILVIVYPTLAVATTGPYKPVADIKELIVMLFIA